MPRDLGPEQLIKWLRSETYNSISRHLEAIAESDLEQQDPLDNALPLQDFENVWRDENAPISFRFDRGRFWDVRDPLLILECLEEKGLWRWRGNRLQPEAPAPAERIVAEMKAHATPQTGRYLRSLERLIAKGIEPQLLEDRELAAKIKITSQRIRQLRHNLKPYLSHLRRTSSHYLDRTPYNWL